MIQQELFERGCQVLSLFVGNPVNLRTEGDRCRAAQLALLTVLLQSRSGTGSVDDITREPWRPYPDGGKWLGPAICQLSKDKLIRSVGAKGSDRAPRRGGLLRQWEIADRDKAILRAERLRSALSFAIEAGPVAATTEPADNANAPRGNGDECNGKA
ncbi:hypothetical protein [Crateriforma conspicua]|uniref:Uncharacterized protein n=1 Tax=Crateriforma conspicua TaxID=2527996 RepID=A0A5C5Y7L4_9PLAN|nr:hypothetical protein [Crateriforma conspicua]TWT70959.1 hypothetical protein Pan14r_32680 [Crateriforma conspicua]